jgi:ribosomal protein S18 acetylase RimI-like enzyme
MVEFEDGSTVINENPHPAFDRISGSGYRITYRVEQEVEPFKDLLVKVLHGGDVIAEADFTDDGLYAHCQNVRVHPRHQRQGIATAVYVYAEKVYGKRLRNFWGDDPKQTPAAKALWAQRNRPFGDPA